MAKEKMEVTKRVRMSQTLADASEKRAEDIGVDFSSYIRMLVKKDIREDEENRKK